MFATLFAFYGILFKRSKLDLIYLFALYLLLLHWTFLNGECIISYVVKLQTDPDYKAGENSKSTDMLSVFQTEAMHRRYSAINGIVWIISIFIVFLRNKIPILYCGIFLCLYITYKIVSMHMLPRNINRGFYRPKKS